MCENKIMTFCCVIIILMFLSVKSFQLFEFSDRVMHPSTLLWNHTCSGHPQHTHTHTQTHRMHYAHTHTHNGNIPSTAEWRAICQFLINSFVRLLKRMRNSINFRKWNNNGPNQNKWIHKTTSLLFITKTHFSNLVWCFPISMGWPVIPS